MPVSGNVITTRLLRSLVIHSDMGNGRPGHHYTETAGNSGRQIDSRVIIHSRSAMEDSTVISDRSSTGTIANALSKESSNYVDVKPSQRKAAEGRHICQRWLLEIGFAISEFT